jgi:hypothetical protein
MSVDDLIVLLIVSPMFIIAVYSFVKAWRLSDTYRAIKRKDK